jgi:hypothetical protein
MAQAPWNCEVIADSDDTVVVEGRGGPPSGQESRGGGTYGGSTAALGATAFASSATGGKSALHPTMPTAGASAVAWLPSRPTS